MTLTLDTPVPVTRSRVAVGQAAAAGATLCLLANGVIALLADRAALMDHTRGAGAASEVTTGLAFLAGAFCFAVLTPVAGWRRLLWLLAPFGLAVGGTTMVVVPLVGAEPPGWLFVLAVLPILVGMVAAGVLGTGRVWPWWTGAALAVFLPVMFTMPFNGLFMTAVWACVTLTVSPRPRAGRRSSGA